MTDEPPVLRTTTLDCSVSGAVGYLTLARPGKLNALSRAMLEELPQAASWFDEETAAKVVVLSGQGRAFCAGFDLADRAWSELGPPEESARVGRVMAQAVAGMRAVTVAAVHGHCIGGGVVLASACDLRVASTDARFAIPEVDLGVPLLWTGVPRLVRELGPALTKELVLTGRPVDADEALRLRLVNRVVPDDELAAAARTLAEQLAAKPALVLRETLRQVDEWLADPSAEGGPDADVATMAAAFADPESRAVAAAYRRGSA